MRSLPSSLLACLLVAMLSRAAHAQPVVAGRVTPAEFATRRARVIDGIGDGIAVLQGTTERPGEQPLRQSNQFFYLTGVIEPRALLLIDGRTRRSTLYVSPSNARREQLMFGPALVPGDSAAKAIGIDAVAPRDSFATALAAAGSASRVIYTPFRPEVLGSASSSDAVGLARATKNDPWDGRSSREEAFRQKLTAAAPSSLLRDLDPIIDSLRGIKSPAEIAIIREATRITGLAIMEAMRDARVGMAEYELQADAEFTFKKYGAYGAAYFALIATGANTFYSHYHKNTALLRDGDLVQFDYAPDFEYYVSDVTRVFPANGRFTARQREFYEIYLALYRDLMTSIRVHATAQDVIKDAVSKMDSTMASYRFTDQKIRAAAQQFVERYRASKANSLGHTIGMEVHDVRNPTLTFEPGQVFTIEPAMQIADEHIGIRLEDVILITERGYENLSAFVPVEIRDIERLMAEQGLSDARVDERRWKVPHP